MSGKIVGADPYRGANGVVAARYGAHRVGDLRLVFGYGFADGEPEEALIGAVLHRLDDASLGVLMRGAAAQMEAAPPAPAARRDGDGWWASMRRRFVPAPQVAVVTAQA
jgi:hypothetical protein